MRSARSRIFWVGILVLAGIGVVETAAHVLFRPSELSRSNFLEHRFASEEMLQRAYVYEKLEQLQDSRPDIIQVGDSSGLHGVHPKIVESYLAGHRYINLSVATNLGHFGYLEVARYMLERDPGIRTLVLYFTPVGGQPRRILVDAPRLMAGDLHTSLNSWFHRLFHFPSVGLRKDVTDFAYYLNGRLNAPDRPLTSNPGYLMLREIIAQSGGWAREGTEPENLLDGIRQSSPAYAGVADRDILRSIRQQAGRISVDSRFDWTTWSTRTYVEIVLDQYRELAAKHDVRLVVATNPTPVSLQTEDFRILYDMDEIQSALAQYQSAHPDVSLLNVEYWPDRKFSVMSHVAAPHSVESSHRLGAFLARSPAARQPARADKVAFPVKDEIVLEMKGNPTTHGLSQPFERDGRVFRHIREGRYEALAYARLDPGRRHRLDMSVRGGLSPVLSAATTVAVFGERAHRLPDHSESGTLVLSWELPAASVQRFDGWVELVISTRGATRWIDNHFDRDATGSGLDLEQLRISAFD